MTCDASPYARVFDIAEAVRESRRTVYVWIDADNYRPHEARMKDLRVWDLRREHLVPCGVLDAAYVASSPDRRIVTVPAEVVDDVEALAFFEPVLGESGPGFVGRLLAQYKKHGASLAPGYRNMIASILHEAAQPTQEAHA